MKVVVEEYAEVVNSLSFVMPPMPVIANATAQPLTTVAAIKEELVGQLTAQVRWTETIHYLVAQGMTHFYEIGSKEVLIGLLKRLAPEAQGLAVGTPQTIELVAEN
jgi:[acyl-carrier-protein] S-malonyltransferase